MRYWTTKRCIQPVRSRKVENSCGNVRNTCRIRVYGNYLFDWQVRSNENFEKSNPTLKRHIPLFKSRIRMRFLEMRMRLSVYYHIRPLNSWMLILNVEYNFIQSNSTFQMRIRYWYREKIFAIGLGKVVVKCKILISSSIAKNRISTFQMLHSTLR